MAPIVFLLVAIVAVALPYDRALDHREAERNWQRAADFIRRAELSQRFELRGWPPLIPGLIYVTIALLAAVFAALSGAWPAFFVAIVFAGLGSPMFLRNIPHLTAPLISCDAQGFRSGAYGEFSWQDIEAMTLQRVSIRGVTLYTLTMRAPVVMGRLSRMHPSVRLLHRFMRKKYRERLQFRLTMCGEAPRVVELVCMTLWERVVGMKEPWFPDNPRAERELERELQALKKRFADEDRQMEEMVERELAKAGLTMAEAFPGHRAPKPAAPPFRDKLERSRPRQTRMTERAVARIPAYRTASIVCLLVIGGLLLLAFRALATAQT
jgi:hypothetical protein